VNAVTRWSGLGLVVLLVAHLLAAVMQVIGMPLLIFLVGVFVVSLAMDVVL
jgi:hypothetical protein